MGLINQATDRAPVWLIKKLTATYLTLGLSDIGREVGIDSPEEVREIILSMVRITRITCPFYYHLLHLSALKVLILVMILDSLLSGSFPCSIALVYPEIHPYD